MRRLLVLAVLTALAALAYSHGPAIADHGVTRCGGNGLQACLLQSSPFTTRVVKPGLELTYCFNNRALQYPGFRSQITTVMNEWATQLRLSGAREVAYPSSAANKACSVRHDMLDNHPCSGCGAWIYVSNDPIVIEYNARTGYSRWESTGGHEFGHGSCLLDEHYDKVNFRSWILTYGYWQHGEPTVMDSGTPYLSAYSPAGIWWPTQYDLSRCAETLGRPVGPSTPVPEWGECGSDAQGRVWCYNNWEGLWHWTIYNPTEWRHTGQGGTPWYCIEGCP